MATSIELIPRILKGLDAKNKYYIYLILLDKKVLTIPEIQNELEKRFGVKIAYSSILSLLDSMYRAGIIDYIEEKPRKVRLIKKVDVIVRDVSEDWLIWQSDISYTGRLIYLLYQKNKSGTTIN